jgi:hypothetical protein
MIAVVLAVIPEVARELAACQAFGPLPRLAKRPILVEPVLLMPRRLLRLLNNFGKEEADDVSG